MVEAGVHGSTGKSAGDLLDELRDAGRRCLASESTMAQEEVRTPPTVIWLITPPPAFRTKTGEYSVPELTAVRDAGIMPTNPDQVCRANVSKMAGLKEWGILSKTIEQEVAKEGSAVGRSKLSACNRPQLTEVDVPHDPTTL